MLYPIVEDGLHGFIDSSGDVVVEPKYIFAEEGSEGMCSVSVLGSAMYDTKEVHDISMSGYVDSEGHEIIAPNFVGSGKRFSEGLAMVRFQPNWKWGFIDKYGSTIIPPRYDQEYSSGFSEGLANVALGKKWGYINKAGEEVIPFEYDWTHPFKCGFALVKKGRKKYFIDKSGNALDTIKCTIVDGVNGGFKEGLAVVKVNKKIGFINSEGQLAIQELFEGTWGFHEGLSAVKLDGKFGYINRDGEFVIEPKFEQARAHNQGVATFSNNRKWGLINSKGDVIKEPCFDYINHFGSYTGDLSQAVDRDLTLALRDKQGYYIDRTGEIIAEKQRKSSAPMSQKAFFEDMFEQTPERKNVWDKAKWYYDGDTITKKSASRHIYFVLKWLRDKNLLTQEGITWCDEEYNIGVGLYRDMVNKQAADFLDRCYKPWYEHESIVNFQIDPGLEFCADERLDTYWQEYLNRDAI